MGDPFWRPQRGIIAYDGSRPESVRQKFADDVTALHAAAKGKDLHEGDLEFADHAAGTAYDVLAKVGRSSFLVFNHTGKMMAELRTNSRWLLAQKPLFALGEVFRVNPLV